MPYTDPKARMAVARAGKAVIEAAKPHVHVRTVVLPPMGQQPVLKLAQPHHVDTIVENPLLSAWEPITFQKETRAMSGFDVGVRRVVEAEIDQLMEWGLPRFLARYPRARAETIRPMLIMACRGGKLAFFRTDDACALFTAEVTPWEPELFVYETFMVSRISVPREVTRLYRAGMKWAIDIGACGFQYGSSTGVDIRKFAEKVGHDVAGQFFVKHLRRDMQLPELDEAA